MKNFRYTYDLSPHKILNSISSVVTSFEANINQAVGLVTSSSCSFTFQRITTLTRLGILVVYCHVNSSQYYANINNSATRILQANIFAMLVSVIAEN